MTGRASWSEHSDASVVQCGVAGDSEALAELYRRYTRMVWKIIHQSVADPHARLDIHQIVFERVMIKLDTLRDGLAFQSWIAQITRRAIVDHYRATARRNHVALDNAAQHDVESTEASPHEWAEMRGLARQVNTAMHGLKQRDATALCLCANGDLDRDEIAAQLGIKEDHARVVLHRARNRLRSELRANAELQMTSA